MTFYIFSLYLFCFVYFILLLINLCALYAYFYIHIHIHIFIQLPLCKFVSSTIYVEFCIMNNKLIILNSVRHKPKQPRIHSSTFKSLTQHCCTDGSTQIAGVLAPTVEWWKIMGPTQIGYRIYFVLFFMMLIMMDKQITWQFFFIIFTLFIFTLRQYAFQLN